MNTSSNLEKLSRKEKNFKPSEKVKHGRFLTNDVRVLKGDSSKNPTRFGEVRVPVYIIEMHQISPVVERVMSRRGVQNLLGMSPKSSGQALDKLVNNHLLGYFHPELLQEFNNPIVFMRNNAGGSQPHTYGLSAAVVTQIFSSLVKYAMFEEHVPKHVRNYARNASVFMEAFAENGLVSAIDAVLDYKTSNLTQEQEFHLILSKTIRRWEQTFPREFFEKLAALNGRDYEEVAHQKFVGRWVNNVIWHRIDADLYEYLQERNPPNAKGYRTYKNAQFLNEHHGLPRLRDHLNMVLHYMRVAKDYEDLKSMLDKVSPQKINGRNKRID